MRGRVVIGGGIFAPKGADRMANKNEMSRYRAPVGTASRSTAARSTRSRRKEERAGKRGGTRRKRSIADVFKRRRK